VATSGDDTLGHPYTPRNILVRGKNILDFKSRKLGQIDMYNMKKLVTGSLPVITTGDHVVNNIIKKGESYSSQRRLLATAIHH
jgi:hypothetical protein